MSKSRAFSLMELVVVMSLLGLIIGGAFLIFRMGSRGFQQAIVKTGAVGDIHRFSRVAHRDIGLSHFNSAEVEKRQITEAGETLERDGVGICGLSDWSDASNFGGTLGLPNWNRWTLFYATDEAKGRLIRLETQRAKPSGSLNYYPITPMPGIADLMSNDPIQLPQALRVTTLCHNVRSFSAELDTYKRIVKMTLVLHNKTGRRMTSQQTVEDYLETRVEIYPVNSYPEL